MHFVDWSFYNTPMSFQKIFLAVVIGVFGIALDWFAIVWGMENKIAPMYLTIAVLVLTAASIWLIIWDLRS